MNCILLTWYQIRVSERVVLSFAKACVDLKLATTNGEFHQ